MPTLNVDETTAALWRFDEGQAYVPPVDAVARMAPLAPVVAGQFPAIVKGALGPARALQDGFAFRGSEAVTSALRLRRSMTVEAVLAYTPNGGVQTVACRGLQDGTAAERRLWSVSLLQVGGQPALRFEWDRASGVNAFVDDVPLVKAPTGAAFYLAVTREWVSPTAATVRAYVNGSLASSVTSSQADIESGDGGTTTIGTRWDQAGGTFTNFYTGPIELLRVSSEARSAEEIEHTYRSLFVYPGYAYELLRSLLPPGEAWSRNLDSRIQQFFQVAGGGLSIAWTKAAELLGDFLPDRAWSLLGRWEAITRLSPRPNDTIQQRRDRVVGFLRKVQGYDLASIRGAIGALLGQAPGDVVIKENSNLVVDSFDGAAPAALWSQDLGDGSVSVAGGKLTLSCAAGKDLRWTASTAKPVRLRTSVASDVEVEVITSVVPGLQDTGASCGLYVYNLVNGSTHLFGILRGGSLNKLWHRVIENGVVTETTSPIIVPLGQVCWLRYKLRGNGAADLQFNFFGSGSFDGPWLTAFSVPTIAAPKNWCGPFVSADVAPSLGVTGADFLDFRIWTPSGRDVFQWYVYRDPALAPTAYDRASAQLVIDKLKPAHTRGTVIEALGFVVGSSFCRVGGEPVGAV